MLTPQFDQLLQLRHQAQNLKFVSSRHSQAQLAGLYASVFRGQGIEFEEVREYQPGEEIRHIDWRVTARMNKPYLKIYREERERRVILCVDTGIQMQFGTRGTFKSVQAAKVAALLGWSAYQHGDRIGGLLFGQAAPRFFRPTRSSHGLGQFLHHLTMPPNATATTDSTLEQALTLLNRTTPTGALLFLIADFNQIAIKALQQTLRQLHQRHELVLITIDDPADHTLPAIGTVSFVTPDGNRVLVNTDNPQGRLAYSQLWETQRQQLEQLTQQLHCALLTISTQEDAYQSLLHGLQQRAQRQGTHQ
jgi:uncharacterized protein (DUF58 family)